MVAANEDVSVSARAQTAVAGLASGAGVAASSVPLGPVGAGGLVLVGAALMRRRRAKARAQRIIRTW